VLRSGRNRRRLGHFAHSTRPAQAGGFGEISVRRIDPRPSKRSPMSELHAQTFPNRRALLQAVNIIRLSGTDVLGFELAHDIGDLASIFDAEVEQRAA